MSLLFSYYGDDFTGSTDALEALASNGVSTVLFLGIPAKSRLEQFAGCQAIGIAGESRSHGVEWMEHRLPAIFRWMRSLEAPFVQYKVCSTFDSSPEIGNIGLAMRIGRQVFESRCVPVVVAAPRLRRYVLFGNLFAAAGDAIYRIDRHPGMQRHPVTPMGEGDLRRHLCEQASGPVELLDIVALTGQEPDKAFEKSLSRGTAAVVFDGLDERSELATGRLLWAQRARHPFAVGSSGLTYALVRHWREANLIPEQSPAGEAKSADQIIILSGSCSLVTQAQIQSALDEGFEGLSTHSANREELINNGLEALSRGRSLIVYSAFGPHDLQGSLSGEHLGRYLGTILRDLIVQSGVRRVVVAGGDTATHAASQLSIDALTFVSALAPGAPLCRAHSRDLQMEGLEVVLKGGQVGSKDFFQDVRKGRT